MISVIHTKQMNMAVAISITHGAIVLPGQRCPPSLKAMCVKVALAPKHVGD